jgi:hypothetical protein
MSWQPKSGGFFDMKEQYIFNRNRTELETLMCQYCGSGPYRIRTFGT